MKVAGQLALAALSLANVAPPDSVMGECEMRAEIDELKSSLEFKGA